MTRLVLSVGASLLVCAVSSRGHLCKDATTPSWWCPPVGDVLLVLITPVVAPLVHHVYVLIPPVVILVAIGPSVTPLLCLPLLSLAGIDANASVLLFDTLFCSGAAILCLLLPVLLGVSGHCWPCFLE